MTRIVVGRVLSSGVPVCLACVPSAQNHHLGPVERDIVDPAPHGVYLRDRQTGEPIRDTDHYDQACGLCGWPIRRTPWACAELALPDGYFDDRTIITVLEPIETSGNLFKFRATASSGFVGIRWAHRDDHCLACGRTVGEHARVTV